MAPTFVIISNRTNAERARLGVTVSSQSRQCGCPQPSQAACPRMFSPISPPNYSQQRCAHYCPERARSMSWHEVENEIRKMLIEQRSVDENRDDSMCAAVIALHFARGLSQARVAFSASLVPILSELLRLIRLGGHPKTRDSQGLALAALAGLAAATPGIPAATIQLNRYSSMDKRAILGHRPVDSGVGDLSRVGHAVLRYAATPPRRLPNRRKMRAKSGGSQRGPGHAPPAGAKLRLSRLAADAAAKDVKVETDNYVALFTNQGARLKSFKFKKYRSLG